MKTCWRALPRLAGRANPTKPPTIRLWIAVPSCWIQRFWKKRASRPAGPSLAWRKLRPSSQPRRSTSTDQRSAVRLNLYGGSVGEHLGDALHYFSGVIAEAHHCVGAMLGGVHQQQFVRFDAGPLAQLGEDGDVAADNGLQRRPQISDYAARAHDDSANHSEIADNPVTRQL